MTSPDLNFESRISALRDSGISEKSLNLLESSIAAQQKYLPAESVLNWLDDHLLRMGIELPPEEISIDDQSSIE